MIDYPYRPRTASSRWAACGICKTPTATDAMTTSSVFAEHMVWPTGVVCWKGGVYVAAAPDVWY